LRNGFKSLKQKDTDPAFFTEQRTRLYFDYRREKIQLHIAAQDVRIWGNTDQIYKTDPALTNLYEAWGRYDINEKFGFKIGRQSWDYDNARIMGNLDWAQQGRSHDGFLFLCKNPKQEAELHVGLAFNQDISFEPGKLTGTEYFGMNNYKTVQFAWWHKKLDEGKISILIHNDGQQVRSDTSVAYRQSYGVTGTYKLGGVDIGGEFYFQGGKNGSKEQVRAFLIALNATFQSDLTPITVGTDILSGTGRDEDNDKSFAPLYGTNHKFYGYMDYFYVGNFHGQGNRTSGLIDLYLKTNFKIGNKSALNAHLHQFLSPVKIYEDLVSENIVSSNLGTEVDLVYQLQILDDLKLFVGYSQMFAGRTMEIIKNVDDPAGWQNWAWAMIAFKPRLFSSEAK
jgi:hypothetical protein